MKSIRLLLLLASGVTTGAFAQSGGLTDMSQSRFAKMANTELGAVHWTDGFWGDRFNVYSHTSLQSMWDTWNNPDVSHGFRNFEIAAGVCEGEHWGPPFHDGDMYKWMEGVASVYAVTKDPELDKLMDHFIEHVVKAQRAVRCMTVLRRMVPAMSRTVFRKYTKAMAVLISCLIVRRITRPAPISAICFSTGVCWK